jgi:hypothetical protein
VRALAASPLGNPVRLAPGALGCRGSTLPSPSARHPLRRDLHDPRRQRPTASSPGLAPTHGGVVSRVATLDTPSRRRSRTGRRRRRASVGGDREGHRSCLRRPPHGSLRRALFTRSRPKRPPGSHWLRRRHEARQHSADRGGASGPLGGHRSHPATGHHEPPSDGRGGHSMAISRSPVVAPGPGDRSRAPSLTGDGAWSARVRQPLEPVGPAIQGVRPSVLEQDEGHAQGWARPSAPTPVTPCSSAPRSRSLNGACRPGMGMASRRRAPPRTSRTRIGRLHVEALRSSWSSRWVQSVSRRTRP